MASNDVTALFFVTFISYYGDYWNKIRWIGGGGVIFGELKITVVGRGGVPFLQVAIIASLNSYNFLSVIVDFYKL